MKCIFYSCQLKLVNPSRARLEQLITQLKWRLQEGQGEAIYEIGVEDNGMLAGLTQEELNMSLNTLRKMAAKLGSEATVLREQVVEGCKSENNERFVAEVLIRKVSDDHQVLIWNVVCKYGHVKIIIKLPTVTSVY